jgi:rhodanese-related sulfurtransferase
MSTLFRITFLGFISLIIGIGTNQLIHQGIRLPILLLTLPRIGDTVDLIDVSVYEAYDLLNQNKSSFIDIRPKIEFDIDHIPGALSRPFTQYFGQQNLIDTTGESKMIIVYGFEPNDKEAELLAEQLVKRGYNQTRILQGGFAAWIENRFPLETEENL